MSTELILCIPGPLSGHTFSLSPEAPICRLTLKRDETHDSDDPFFNEHGVWFFIAG